MKTLKQALSGVLIGLLTLCSPLALADDTEVFFNALDTQSTQNAPNLLFILDTGATMNENLGGDPAQPVRRSILSWKAGTAPEAAAFTFVPPKGATRIAVKEAAK